MKLSIIVPILNEAVNLPELLEQLLPYQRGGSEVILVDGGSEDGSPQLANCMGFEVIHAPRGRARQQNAGALQAHGEILVFLHADTVLPFNAERLIQQSMDDTKRVWGRFDVRIQGSSPMFGLISTLMNGRSRLTGIATGDQAIFVTREAFQKIGHFPDQALMEDIELSIRLKKLSKPICLNTPVMTSGRRWETYGIWKTIFLMWYLRWQYWLGVSPDVLRKAYK